MSSNPDVWAVLKITKEDIKDKLLKMAEEEGIEISEDKLELIDEYEPHVMNHIVSGLKERLSYDFDNALEGVIKYDLGLLEDNNSTWIDKHSVNCIKCGELFDEREGYTPKNGEGTLCPKCQKGDDE